MAEPIQYPASATGQALRDESLLEPGVLRDEKKIAEGPSGAAFGKERDSAIRIRGARAHNLKDITVELPWACLSP